MFVARCSVVLLGLLLCPLSAFAADATWVGGVDPNFWNNNNWSPKDLTGKLTVVAGSSYNPQHSKDRPNYSGFRPTKLNVEAGGYLIVNGGTLTPTSSDYLNGQVTIVLGGLNVLSTTYLGKNAAGTVTVNGGTFTQSGTMTIGYGSGGVGKLNVIGGTVNFAGKPTIGASGGTGHIYVREGGFCYCPSNQTTFFQGLVTSGTITTDPNYVVVVDYTGGSTRITARRSRGAILPAPWDKTELVGATTLAWTSDYLMTGNQVYFGTDQTAVYNATTSTAGIYLGTTTSSSMAIPYVPAAGVTYYWRVDTVKSTGTVKGTVWSFKAVETLAPRRMEDINRGVVAVKLGAGGVYVGWRMLGTDPADIGFNVYRGATRLNDAVITDTTNYTDAAGTLSDVYSVRPVIGGVEKGCSETAPVWANQYLDIPVQQIPGDTGWTYTINDGAAGDLDGDAKYELVIKRLPPSSIPGSHAYIEAYKMTGTLMWRVDLGRNIIAPEEIDQIVYDFDGDGKAEVALKTSEGTIDGMGVTIGDTNGDGMTDYSSSAALNSMWYMTDGPEFLSIFDGATGKELARTEYIRREPISQWGLAGQNISQVAHRGYKFHMTPACLDGRMPSLVIFRGIYERIKSEAWNFHGGQLQKIWEFDSANYTGYNSQGNHNLSVGDVDQDGRDEIAYGGCVIDHDGKGLYTTALGHGDAMHLSDMDPNRPGLEIWRCLEGGKGTEYRDARTGEVMIRFNSASDCGRCCAADIDPTHPGYELWAGTRCPLYSCDGTVLLDIYPLPLSMNYVIYWDGDLLRELLDHNWLGDPPGTGVGRIDKWDYVNNVSVPLLTATGTYSCNYTKGTPVLQADLLGDWREEVVWRGTDNKFLRLYTTNVPTTYRIFTLMHDPQYRLAVAWQVCTYNQPPHPGFYLGTGMTYPPASPNIVLVPNQPKPDLSGDCMINFADFAVMADSWAQADCSYSNNWCGGTDLSYSGTVDINDMAIMAAYWLQCSAPVCSW
jgi:hypothetical protein